MRAQVSIQFIEGLKVTTSQKTAGEGTADVVTGISFQCKTNPITLMRLHSLLKQNCGLDVSFVARQATFDWAADPGMDIIRKVCETPPEECAIPASTLEKSTDTNLAVPGLKAGAKAKAKLPDAPEIIVTLSEAETNPTVPGWHKGHPVVNLDRPINYGNVGKETPICDRCVDKGTEVCVGAEAFSGAVTSCTSFKPKAAAADTVPVAVTEPGGNGQEKTRYIPGKGRRKTAKAG